MKISMFFLLLVMLGAINFQGFGETLQEQNQNLLKRLKEVHQLSEEQQLKLKNIFHKSPMLSQGNPAITKHPITVEQCQAKLKQQNITYENQEFEKICHGKYQTPLYDVKTQKVQDAKICIDQFEFPNIPCEYPLVWVRADEAVQICQAVGKRLCDAHEWEGACEGNLKAPDYDFSLVKKMSPEAAIKTMRINHNKTVATQKTWSYGNEYKPGICGAASFKHDGCDGGNWQKCGSNTYPVGSFPDCRSSLAVYDIHGNAAEHMNLPLSLAQMASHPSQQYGYTEMKGSWFIFDKYRAHDDHCRWRAPFWHGSKVLDEKSHHNYHLGFRCCQTVK